MSRVRRGPIFQAPRPRERQATRRAHLASEQIGGGPAAFIARVPHLEHGAHVLEPGHRHGLARVEHDDRVRVHRRHFRDQAVLIAGQAEERPIAAPGEHDRDFGGARRGNGLGERALLHFGSDPGETHLHWITAAIGLDLDGDGVRARASILRGGEGCRGHRWSG